MANNRMYLRNKRTEAKVLLAKYYPSTGWYPFHIPNEGIDLPDKMSKVFDDNAPEPTQWGDNDWTIEYEMEAETPNDEFRG